MIQLREKSYGLFADIVGTTAAVFAFSKKTGDLLIQPVSEGALVAAPALIRAGDIDKIEVQVRAGIRVYTKTNQIYRIDGSISSMNIDEWEYSVNFLVRQHQESP